MTYNVFVGTLSLTQSINQPSRPYNILLLSSVKYVNGYVNYCDIVDCIRTTRSVPAAVPQMMKLMKRTVICSLLMCWRLSSWISKHFFLIL